MDTCVTCIASGAHKHACHARTMKTDAALSQYIYQFMIISLMFELTDWNSHDAANGPHSQSGPQDDLIWLTKHHQMLHLVTSHPAARFWTF